MYVAYQIGVHTDEFYCMTHKEFMAAVKGYKESQKMDDIRTARVCAVIAEVNRNPKKRGAPWKIEDFMPKMEKKKQTPEEMLAVFEALVKEKPQ